uniref:Claudin-18-like n=1 Tax=Ciona intestinalis TaxID=7719 RepID=F6PUA0_CIOIN|nr:claudin-18-like [Ciona intestinalis]|eukprot:XP_002124078.1 claudin-18-like [Ciona intestinalis]
MDIKNICCFALLSVLALAFDIVAIGTKSWAVTEGPSKVGLFLICIDRRCASVLGRPIQFFVPLKAVTILLIISLLGIIISVALALCSLLKYIPKLLTTASILLLLSGFSALCGTAIFTVGMYIARNDVFMNAIFGNSKFGFSFAFAWACSGIAIVGGIFGLLIHKAKCKERTDTVR